MRIESSANQKGFRVVFVAPRFHTNQIHVVNALLEVGWSVGFLVQKIGKTEDHSRVIPIVVRNSVITKFVRTTLGRIAEDERWRIPSVRHLLALLRWPRPDVVVVRDPVTVFALYTAVIARLLGIRVVFYTQVRIQKRHSLFRSLCYRALMRVFGASWYSPVLGDYEPWGGGILGLHYVPFPMSIPSNEALDRQPESRFTLLVVGKFVPRKQHEVLLRAVAASSVKADIDVLIVGEASSDDMWAQVHNLRKVAAECGLSTRVHFHVNVPPREMHDLYSIADVFVLPSTGEPASISILEAMSYGLPVLVSEDCGNVHLVSHGKTGLRFKSDDIPMLAGCLSQMADVSARKSMGRMARAAVKSAHSYERFLASFSACVELPL